MAAMPIQQPDDLLPQFSDLIRQIGAEVTESAVLEPLTELQEELDESFTRLREEMGVHTQTASQLLGALRQTSDSFARSLKDHTMVEQVQLVHEGVASLQAVVESLGKDRANWQNVMTDLEKQGTNTTVGLEAVAAEQGQVRTALKDLGNRVGELEKAASAVQGGLRAAAAEQSTAHKALSDRLMDMKGVLSAQLTSVQSDVISGVEAETASLWLNMRDALNASQDAVRVEAGRLRARSHVLMAVVLGLIAYLLYRG